MSNVCDTEVKNEPEQTLNSCATELNTSSLNTSIGNDESLAVMNSTSQYTSTENSTQASNNIDDCDISCVGDNNINNNNKNGTSLAIEINKSSNIDANMTLVNGDTSNNSDQLSTNEPSAINDIDSNNINSNSNNKKRKYDADSNSNNSNANNNTNKRSNNSSNSSLNSKNNYTNGQHSSSSASSNPGDNEVYFKLLIPSSAAGGVIGRGGEKIAQIQKDSNVKMKMSKANDYYPNTNERVCLIIGSIKAVLKAHDYIVERMQEKPELNKTQNNNNNNNNSVNDSEDRANQIKILIPNGTAGLLIGKGGAFIKQIKDESGAFVQISSKQTDLPERIVTIEGDLDKRNRALNLVIKKIAEDPQHNSVTNLNYSSLLAQQQQQQQHGSGHHGPSGAASVSQESYAGLSNLALLIINCGGSYQMTAESLKVSLRNAGYSSSAAMEIIDAITVLMSYGLITKVSPAAILSGQGVNPSSMPSNPPMPYMMSSGGNAGPPQPPSMNQNLNNYPGGSHHHQQHHHQSHHHYNNNGGGNQQHQQSHHNHHQQQQQQHHHHHSSQQQSSHHQIPPSHHNQHHSNHHQQSHHSHMNGSSSSNNLGNVMHLLSNPMAKVKR